ncbi:hypothetical protein AGLY_016055 [Aphis glycines]|uniref:Uncharacterized protein n=1 Tax=Aphis glycines TaxID=307491 RepID=A0A6G0SYQ5_APHGL|nr:hypothetical protein AGLY_016055 [Aphis glycines]
MPAARISGFPGIDVFLILLNTLLVTLNYLTKSSSVNVFFSDNDCNDDEKYKKFSNFNTHLILASRIPSKMLYAFKVTTFLGKYWKKCESIGLANKCHIEYCFVTEITQFIKFLNFERSDECIDFTMIITSRNNAPISNYGGGFRCKSEYPWCIIEIMTRAGVSMHFAFFSEAFCTIIVLLQICLSFYRLKLEEKKILYSLHVEKATGSWYQRRKINNNPNIHICENVYFFGGKLYSTNANIMICITCILILIFTPEMTFLFMLDAESIHFFLDKSNIYCLQPTRIMTRAGVSMHFAFFSEAFCTIIVLLQICLRYLRTLKSLP